MQDKNLNSRNHAGILYLRYLMFVFALHSFLHSYIQYIFIVIAVSKASAATATGHFCKGKSQSAKLNNPLNYVMH